MAKRAKPLAEYDAKRDFTKSPEPSATLAKTVGRSFCVQKHLASHLHYDFRLEYAGVLLSWAVPKGPSLNPIDKRMAVHVEDHPVDYGTFEGVIPSGYGAGVVMLWDRGTWQPEKGFEDVDAAMKKGELKFTLAGVKLKGSWVLVRTRRPAAREQWLLIKHRDRHAGDIDVASAAPDSVKSFGDFATILADAGAPPEWSTTPPAKGGDAGATFAQLLSTKPLTHRKPVEPRAIASVPRKMTLSAAQPKLTNQSKILFPKTKFTKGDLVAYYRRVAPLILPHLAGRAVSLKRFPDGVAGESFFEKRCNVHRPEWVPTVRVTTNSGKAIDYCEISDERTLVWAANLGAIELHVPLALAGAPDTPTAMVFDLDPGEPATLKDCVPLALRLKGMLDALKLTSVLKTSGGKGLHLLVPLNTPDVTFDDTKTFARAIALTLEKDDPKRVIASMSRAARAGKIFLDWSQNDREKTTACAFSVRARDEPTISCPVNWDDLTPKRAPALIRADQFDLPPKTFAAYLATLKKRQSLPKA